MMKSALLLFPSPQFKYRIFHVFTCSHGCINDIVRISIDLIIFIFNRPRSYIRFIVESNYIGIKSFAADCVSLITNSSVYKQSHLLYISLEKVQISAHCACVSGA